MLATIFRTLWLICGTGQVGISIRADLQHKIQVVVCVQQKFKSACASTKSGQSPSFPPEETWIPRLPIERPSRNLIRLRACIGI